MNGQEVYKFAVREVPLIIDKLFKKTNYKMLHATIETCDKDLIKYKNVHPDLLENIDVCAVKQKFIKVQLVKDGLNEIK